MDLTSAAVTCESLGNVTRLAIFHALVRAGPEGLAVGQLQQRLGIPGSTLSHHISHLVQHDLLTQTREGRVLRCVANFAHMSALVEFLRSECCADSDCC